MWPLLDDEELEDPEEPSPPFERRFDFLILLTSREAWMISNQLTSAKGDLETKRERGQRGGGNEVKNLTFQKGEKRHERFGRSRSP